MAVLVISLVIYSGVTKPKQSINSARQITDTNSGLTTSFSQEPINVDKSLTLSQINKPDKTPVRIMIPSVQIDLPVKEAKIVNGYWEVFPTGAGFGLGSAYPDEIGNTVIFAHARKGMFLPLKEVKVKDNIYVFTKDKWYGYKVEEIKEVLPSQIEVIAPTKNRTLTLFTCTGFADSKRLIVMAKPIT